MNRRRRIVLVLTLVLATGAQLACHQRSDQTRQSRAVLPNAELLRCRSAECAQIWSTAGARPDAVTPWRVTFERLGNDPCPNGIIALYDKNVSMQELTGAVTEQYGPPSLKGPLPGGTWNVASKNLVISLLPLADESSPEEHPSADAAQDGASFAFTTDAFHEAAGRNVPRKELKELILLAKLGTSCGVHLDKPK